mgnify:CR=1 FL=1
MLRDQVEQVLADVRERDARDSERAEAPLKPAADAVLIDTSEMSIEEAVAAAIAVVSAHRTASTSIPRPPARAARA